MPLISSRPLIAGDVVFECKPILHCIRDEFKGKFCDNCLIRCHSTEICFNCRQMYYCGKRCQIKDWKYHQKECKVLWNQRLESNFCSLKERLLLRLWFSITSDDTFATRRHHVMDGSDVSLNDMAVNVEKLSEDLTIVSMHYNSYGLEFNRKELLHWFRVMSTKYCCHRIQVLAHNSLQSIGVQMYVQTQTMRHSCQPNCAFVTNGLSGAVRAMRGIRRGEEITISYIGLDHKRTDRRAQLKQIYGFDCNCLKCDLHFDSDIDYSILRDLDKQYLSFESDDKLSSVDCDQLFESVFNVLSIYETIYGKYSSKTSELLYLVLRIVMNSRHSDEVLMKRWAKRVDDHLIVTHGCDHILYKQFLKICLKSNALII